MTISVEFVALDHAAFDFMTHCSVCHCERSKEWPLNDSGYCENCWRHIPAKFRTPRGRLDEQRRMIESLKRGARAKRRDLRVPFLIWNETRNTWTWRLRNSDLIASKHGDLLRVI